LSCSVGSLFECFGSLESPGDLDLGSSGFVAARIDERGNYRVARDRNSLAVILVALQPRDIRVGLPPITLEHLHIEFDIDCRVQENSSLFGGEDLVLSVIRCRSRDEEMQRLFFEVAGGLLGFLGDRPTRSDFLAGIGQLIELFRSLSLPSEKSIQGVWAELFIIANARDPTAVLRAWHSNPSERFDFAAGDQRLEVKCASGETRAHYFALAQLTPIDNRRVVIASLLVERSSGGATVFSLAERIRGKVQDPVERVRLEAIVCKALGEAWSEAAETSFDLQIAANSLRFFEQSAVPSVRLPLTIGVSEVRFRSDLSHAECLQPELQKSLGGLFGAVLPRRATSRD